MIGKNCENRIQDMFLAELKKRKTYRCKYTKMICGKFSKCHSSDKNRYKQLSEVK